MIATWEHFKEKNDGGLLMAAATGHETLQSTTKKRKRLAEMRRQ